MHLLGVIAHQRGDHARIVAVHGSVRASVTRDLIGRLHAQRIGGLREDLPRGFHEAVRAFLDRFPGKLDEFEGLLTKNDMFVRRTKGVGVVSHEDALAWGLVGPIARASGSDYDVRKYFPYLGYETYDFEVPTATEGDARRSLKEYVASLRPNLTEIYYLAADSLERARSNPKLEAAKARGANILGVVEGCGEMTDAFHRTRSSPDGKPIIGCMRNAIAASASCGVITPSMTARTCSRSFSLMLPESGEPMRAGSRIIRRPT